MTATVYQIRAHIHALSAFHVSCCLASLKRPKQARITAGGCVRVQRAFLCPQLGQGPLRKSRRETRYIMEA